MNAAVLAPPNAVPSASPLPGWSDGLRYGALGAPLAFAALPLYVLLPQHYAERLGAPLAGLGALLLAVRAVDALADPWIGRLADRTLAASRAAALRLAGVAALALALGLAAVFFPLGSVPLLAWCGVALLATSLAYSLLGVLHQAWGARLGGGPAAQARWVAWREGLSLAGVLLASLLPALAGVGAMVVACALLLALALAALSAAPWPAPLPAAPDSAGVRSDPWLPLRAAPFRRLLAVYLLNGVAAAVPATLLLFFVGDRLQATAFAPLFLGAYFLAGALSTPLWVRAVARWGLVRAWAAGMVLAVAAFVWAVVLGTGDVAGFVGVCLASGAALGADLVVPPAALAGVVRRAGHGQRHEGLYFGWWNGAAKLNLALAAGLALPLLDLLGYRPGARGADALWALTLAYALLPCGLKLAAAALLWRFKHSVEPR